MPWLIIWLVGGIILITGELGAVFSKRRGPSQTISSWVWRTRKWTRGASIPVVLIGLAVLGYHFTFQGPANTQVFHEQTVRGFGLRCGVERWDVKTGTDSAASNVNPTPKPTTIGKLDSLSAPSNPTTRVAPIEDSTFQVSATLTGFKLEADSDVHLIISSGGQTMIAEIPDPSCVGPSSPFKAQIVQARQAFMSRFTPTSSIQHVTHPVTLTGVGFFDRIHGQAGVAPNGIELHPILSWVDP